MCVCVCVCVRACVCACVRSDSHNDVPRVAQRYGTIVVFCVHMNRFAGFDKADATADIQ